MLIVVRHTCTAVCLTIELYNGDAVSRHDVIHGDCHAVLNRHY